MSYFLPDSFQAFLPDLIQLLYLVATGFFIVGIKRLGSPATARFGNRLASIGMLIGVAVTLFDREIVTFEFIIAGVVIGALIGVFAARKVQMTAMPEMVAILNGLGGVHPPLLHGEKSPGSTHNCWNCMFSRPQASVYLSGRSLSPEVL